MNWKPYWQKTNSMKQRLDRELVGRGLVATRSQAESYIRLGKVKVNGKLVDKAGHFVTKDDTIMLSVLKEEQYVSRAGHKLASVAGALKLDFKDKLVLDVGSSTGGFSDYALKHGAKRVIAVDVGTEQLHPSLRINRRIELHEKTDIRDFKTSQKPGIILVDLSFISLREVLPSINKLNKSSTQIIVLLKPQFEAGKTQINKGIVKNDKLRRQILKDFEMWTKDQFLIAAKADSGVTGAHGNRERFYLLKPKAYKNASRPGTSSRMM